MEEVYHQARPNNGLALAGGRGILFSSSAKKVHHHLTFLPSCPPSQPSFHPLFPSSARSAPMQWANICAQRDGLVARGGSCAIRKRALRPSAQVGPPTRPPLAQVVSAQTPTYARETMDWSKLLEAIKLPPKYLVPICLASGFLLFGKPSYVALLGLDSFVDSYRPWIGLVFILSLPLLLLEVLQRIWSWLSRKYKNIKSRFAARHRLEHLTQEEKEILREYIFNQSKTQVLDLADGVVQGLVHAKIIDQASPLGSLADGFAYNIQPWAWNYLNKNKHLLSDTDDAVRNHRRSSPFQRRHR